MTGFPWLYLGYGHLNTWLAGYAPTLGVLGVSFIVALTSSLIFYAIQQRGELKRSALICLASLWLVGLALQQISWTEPTKKSLSVAMVQANVPQEEKWDRRHLRKILNRYHTMTEPLWDHDLIIWPETAIPMLHGNAKRLLANLEQKAQESNTTFITGIPFASDRGYGFFNGVVSLGEQPMQYFKRHLVPFGEYMPLEDILRGLIKFFDLPMSEFVSGPDQQPPLIAKGIRISPFICYEIVYPELVASEIDKTDIILTISNDSWFGKSIGPLQHLEMAQMRALENGRYLIRGTNNGITAIINERGQIVTNGQQFTQEVVTGEAKVMTGLTPYSRFGNWPIIILSGLLIGFAYWLKKPSGSDLG